MLIVIKLTEAKRLLYQSLGLMEQQPVHSFSLRRWFPPVGLHAKDCGCSRLVELGAEGWENLLGTLLKAAFDATLWPKKKVKANTTLYK